MTTPQPVERLLASHPLPAADGDKHDRGVAVFVAGSAECPGGAVLSAVAALRAGAGKIQIITAPEVATAVGVAVPEALVVPWDGGSDDELAKDRLERAGAVCIGPGIIERAPEIAIAARPSISSDTPVLLDAGALPAIGAYAATHRLVLAPNVEEAQNLLVPPATEQGVDALSAALTARLRVAVAVRGETTVIAHGEQAWWTRGAPGLGTSGSGDVLAGLVTGFLARGLDDVAALGWAVAVHATAGRQLGQDRPNPGFLARELLDAIPDAVATLSP